ncbi:MAG: hypothetical protein WA993_08515 [Candidatus Binatus sp.]|jgi:hypothetical protein
MKVAAAKKKLNAALDVLNDLRVKRERGERIADRELQEVRMEIFRALDCLERPRSPPR